jgi:hypothetical protein
VEHSVQYAGYDAKICRGPHMTFHVMPGMFW